jgi:HlyD family secretion protein
VKVAAARVQQILAQLAALDEAELDVDVAEAQAQVLKLEGKVADAEAALAEAKLVAPFAGVIDLVKVEPGATVSPGTEVVTMFSAADLRVLARVNDMDVSQLQAGQQAQLAFDAFPGQTFDGQLGDIPALGTYENGMTWFDVEVAFEAGEQPLWVGMGANVYVPLFRKENVLIVPAMAVQSDEEGSFVLLVLGRRTERRRVEVGISDGVNIEIVQGLEKGDVVRIPLSGPIGIK